MVEDIPTDIQDQLREIEGQARTMGESEEQIRAKRAKVLQRLLHERSNEMEAVRGSEDVGQGEAEDFARRTDPGMQFHPETGKPLDQSSEDE